MRTHLDLQGGRPTGVMLPIHWATFNLATHPWVEPGEGTMAAAHAVGARVALPRPGQPFEPTAETVPSEPWWRGVAVPPKGGWPAAQVVRASTAESAEAQNTPAGDGLGDTAEGTGEPETVSAG
jgi:hypothetical protein